MTRVVRFSLALAIMGSCAPAPSPTGASLGTYALRAEGTFKDCELPAPLALDLTASLSQFADGGVLVTINNNAHVGRFDGQVVGYTATAGVEVEFADGGSCSACNTRSTETLTVSLYSRSQFLAVGGSCPANPLDGGTPGPDPDAGITAPHRTDAGFDALLACGELVERFVGEGSCDPACLACNVRYRITGARQ